MKKWAHSRTIVCIFCCTPATYYRILGTFFENSTVSPRNTEKRVCNHFSASAWVWKGKFGMKDTYYRISGTFFEYFIVLPRNTENVFAVISSHRLGLGSSNFLWRMLVRVSRRTFQNFTILPRNMGFSPIQSVTSLRRCTDGGPNTLRRFSFRSDVDTKSEANSLNELNNQFISQTNRGRRRTDPICDGAPTADQIL